MATCPNGHRSMADDWCEVCGHRMMAVAGNASAPPPPGYPAAGPGGGFPTAQAELCPQCRTPRETQGPFCEECRYNFLTNSPTTYLPPQQAPGYPPQPGPPDAGHPGGPGAPGQPGAGHPPSHEHRPAPPQHPAGGRPFPGQQYPGGQQESGDWLLPPPSSPVPPQPDASGDPRSGGYGGGGGGWMVRIGPDRDYFMAMMHRSGPEAAQLTLPAYAPEQRVPLTGQQVTIGRRRQSTGQAPDIDLSRPPEDPGVSHQHAILVQQPDGSWAVVDQDSTNGTTVNGAEEPIQPFIPVPLREGDRVHVGAWTTLTLYRA